jgi:hypothetical protein
MISDLSPTFFGPAREIPSQLFGVIPPIVLVLIVGPKLFIEPGTKAFFQLSSVSGPGL